jgi:hypothetical protein
MMGKFKTYEEFKDDYEEYHYIDKVSNRYYPQRPLNTKQLQRYYLQYVKKWDKANSKNDNKSGDKSRDMLLYEKIIERDKGCRLLAVLTFVERRIWDEHQNGMGGILDGAHVFGKGAYPWMRYEVKNVVTLNRFSHSCLDSGKSPINGKTITDEERKSWWRRIVGDDWEYLTRRANKSSNNE